MPIAFADITIKTEQNIYNLRNDIKASVSVLQSNNFEGLFKLTLSCGNYKLQYFYSTPISLEANFRTAIDMKDPLKTTSSMLGNCTIIGDLVTNDNLVIEEEQSNSFSITDQLTVLPVKNKIESLPAEAIQVTGIINEAFGNNVLKSLTKIMLDNNSYTIDAVDGRFSLDLEIPKNIKSGKHTIEISAVDSKNNVGSSSIELEITAVPSYIKTDLSGNKLLPGSKIEIVASLYDQADDLINASLDLELASPDGNKVFRKIVQSNEKIDYEFSQYAEPGLYALVSTYKNLLTQTSINITAIREVKVIYENETVFIENVGNVPFEDELTFILESESKKYPITKKINVEPSKILSLDLSKEVPLGIYDVILSIKKGLAAIKEKINETSPDIAESAQESLSNLLPEDKNVLAANVTI
ncbi:hypothetical protein HYX00_04045, partial [Candidatus Woesearchaeota archaeon]|nr:hypothetical protein [Candidatus Woesearchaeota archaeon]